ncbi:MAG: NAD-dependent epimerase/dehydratase family protein [Deltaproteobacteria bacterium]|nr:NAD-dependent epimerase/dehydratase family protein [Deltaproteobacteria bacterium]MCL5277592.1 NAD-dependent epimerase/dehydratase family protein [Deltaproteobacteria bacterium]
MTEAVVTGAAGFIGSHLSVRLLENGYDVIGIDSFEDYYPRWIKEKNLMAPKRHERFRLVEGSLALMDLKHLLDGADYVFHEAAQPGIGRSFGQFFDAYVANNIVATQRLLEALKGSRVRRLVYASSSSVYGNTHELPARESTTKMPYSPYGVTKFAGEQLVKVYNDNFGVPCVSLRYFTVYGPGQRPDMAFHRFIKSALEGSPIVLYGDGRQTRDFTYVSDIVDANMLALDAPPGTVFNIGGGDRVCLIDAVRMIGKLTGKNTEIEFQPPQRGDVRDTYADLTNAQAGLGYRPQAILERGLVQEIEYIKQLYNV